MAELANKTNKNTLDNMKMSPRGTPAEVSLLCMDILPSRVDVPPADPRGKTFAGCCPLRLCGRSTENTTKISNESAT
jgi:hypothetical protein